jgi:tRNA A-37 threonylcarbamoyl transferase component Bud32
VKRPRPKYWHRYLTQIGRGPRPRRAWRKAWRIIARDIPTAWPMLLMERRKLGYVVDTLIVYERVAGTLLTKLDLDALDENTRDTLFRRLGRTLRRLEDGGLAQFDAKSSNWMIVDDSRLGPVPIVIDVDGVGRSWASTDSAAAIQRLLRSMRDHAQYTPADSLALCQGYAPYAARAIAREAAKDAAETEGSATS